MTAELTRLSPHEANATNRDFFFMTLPLLAIGTYLNGLRVVALCLAAAVTALICDRIAALMRRVPYSRAENSSIAFALIVVMMLPASVPYYVVISCTIITTLVAKAAFGGYGSYVFFPPAVGFAFAAVSWPDVVFRYPQPFTPLGIRVTSQATLVSGASHTLAAGGMPNISLFNLVLGNYAGPMGTTAVLVTAACAMYLWMRKRITFAVPGGFLLACAGIVYFFPRLGGIGMAWPWLFVRDRLLVVVYELLSGALLFASVFLINDPVTLPKDEHARFVYGLLLGLATMMFRYFGAYDLGVCFAILLMNVLVGPIDRMVRRARDARTVRRRRAAAARAQRETARMLAAAPAPQPPAAAEPVLAQKPAAAEKTVPAAPPAGNAPAPQQTAGSAKQPAAAMQPGVPARAAQPVPAAKPASAGQPAPAAAPVSVPNGSKEVPRHGDR